MNVFFIASVISFLVFWQSSVFAKPSSCTQLFSSPTQSVRLHADPVRQWLEWETSVSVPQWRQHGRSSALKISMVPANNLKVESAPSLSEDVQRYFQRGTEFAWIKHPFNLDEDVPYFSADETFETLEAEHTASRSVAVRIDGRLYGLKLPTDHPFGKEGEAQYDKSDLRDDIDSARRRSEVVEEVDKRIGEDPKLIVLREVISVKDLRSGNGFIVRDLTPLEDGKYYFPAHQIPHFGKQIAERNGQSFDAFWQERWAIPLGVVQAKVLVRYAFETEAVNPQNYLIQFDENMKPTGVIVYRDVSDSFQVLPIAKAIGLNQAIKADRASKWGFRKSIQPDDNAQTLAWRFDESEDTPMSLATEISWRASHNQAYIRTVQELLRIQLPQETTLTQLNTFLLSPEGKTAIQKFHRQSDRSRR